MPLLSLRRDATGIAYACFEEPDGLRFNIRRMADESLQVAFSAGKWEPVAVYPQLDVAAIEAELQGEL